MLGFLRWWKWSMHDFYHNNIEKKKSKMFCLANKSCTHPASIISSEHSCFFHTDKMIFCPCTSLRSCELSIMFVKWHGVWVHLSISASDCTLLLERLTNENTMSQQKRLTADASCFIFMTNIQNTCTYSGWTRQLNLNPGNKNTFTTWKPLLC